MYRKDWIEKWAIYSPNRVAISEYETNRSVTYKQLNLQANQVTDHFVSSVKLILLI